MRGRLAIMTMVPTSLPAPALARALVRAAPLAAVLAVTCVFTGAGQAAVDRRDKVKSVADAVVRPVMARYAIPGMAVGITVRGRSYVFDYGVASRETHKPVTGGTLFEIGSVSKTFTATLASYAHVNGNLSFQDTTSTYLPALRGTTFGRVRLLSLGTHTAGGFPLQLPGDVKNDDQLMTYLARWQPTYPPDTYRTYANPSIGVLGLITAKSMHRDFVALMQDRLFPALGMTRSYIDVPRAKGADYAQGYTKSGTPIRMAAAVLSSEAYGIKSTAADMIRFVNVNMDAVRLDARLRRAVADTHTGYFKAGDMTQDLIWEQYPYPVGLRTLVNANVTSSAPARVTRITPPQAPRTDVLINKTGSTNGFGTYVAFVPEERFGIVILANRNYPIAERVRIAYQILSKLAGEHRSSG